MPNEAITAFGLAAGAAEVSPVEKLAQFFPGAVAMRLPVQVVIIPSRAAGNPRADAQELKRARQLGTIPAVIEFGTPQEVLFASKFPLEFEDKIRLENCDGSFTAEACVVAVQYHNGGTAVAARFTRAVANWIIKP